MINVVLIFSIIILIIILFTIIVNVKCEYYRKQIPSRTIWILWLQGWENIPKIVELNLLSWKKHNKNWNIELVSEKNLNKYIDLPEYIIEKRKNKKIKAYSDIIRLALLNRYGGVWVDATVLCMHPLDNWIDDVIRPNGFWMYSSTFATKGKSRGPCIWFIISMKPNYIIKKWYNEILKYWKENDTSEYFLTDKLFVDLKDSDTNFENEWNKSPVIWSKEGEGNASMLAGIVFEDIHSDKSKNAILNFKERCPYVVKLSRHKNLTENSLGMYAINESLYNNNLKFYRHEIVNYL
jgi:hypothetical protein